MTSGLLIYVGQSSAAVTCEAQTSAQAISKELTYGLRDMTPPPVGLLISTSPTAEQWGQELA